MNRGTISYDRADGKLVSGLVWRLGPCSVSDSTPEGMIYADVADEKCEEISSCPVDRRHVTDLDVRAISLDVFGGKHVGDWVPVNMCYPIVSQQFASRVLTSGLNGFSIRAIVAIACNQSLVPDLRLFYFKCEGHGGNTFRRWKVTGAPNICPHCGKTPMVCPNCGNWNWPNCVNCGELSLFRPDAPEYSHPKGLKLEDNPKGEDLEIVEGKQWDGSDFFKCDGGSFVSNRAKEWLERTHTYPIKIEPALLNIEGVEGKFKGQ